MSNGLDVVVDVGAAGAEVGEAGVVAVGAATTLRWISTEWTPSRFLGCSSLVASCVL